MSNQILTTIADATETQKGVSTKATPTPIYSPIPIKRFSSATVAEPNFCYVLTDPTTETPAPLQLPERGSFKPKDEIEVVNLSGTTFKITLKQGGDNLIRFDDKTIESIDGKFLLSGGNGSFIRLKAENYQLWFVINRNNITISSG